MSETVIDRESACQTFVQNLYYRYRPKQLNEDVFPFHIECFNSLHDKIDAN